MRMTWGEFKRAVESQGVKDDDELAWVDMNPAGSFPGRVEVERYSGGDVSIIGWFYDYGKDRSTANPEKRAQSLMGSDELTPDCDGEGQWVVVIGPNDDHGFVILSPDDEQDFVGPFSKYETAIEWARKNSDEVRTCWTVRKITKPEDFKKD